MTETAPREHVDPHEVTSYLEGALAPAARQRFEAHLAECEECTAELVAVGRLRHTPRARVRWIGLAAAAGLAVILLAPRLEREAAVTSPTVRGDATQAIGVVAPADGAVLREAPVFAWRPVAGAAAYRISVTRNDGDSVWATTTADTAVRPPEGAVPPALEHYFWYVDALLSDGRSVPGKPHRFSLSP